MPLEQRLSEHAFSLLTRLLRTSFRERISVDAALQSSWITTHEQSRYAALSSTATFAAATANLAAATDMDTSTAAGSSVGGMAVAGGRTGWFSGVASAFQGIFGNALADSGEGRTLQSESAESMET